MAVDDRYKRGSATSTLQMGITPLAQPNTAGVDQLERQAIVWVYSGILAAGAPTTNLLDFERATGRGVGHGVMRGV